MDTREIIKAVEKTTELFDKFIMQKDVIIDAKETVSPALRCPNCNGIYVHQHKWEETPEKERGGIRIYFWCEECYPMNENFSDNDGFSLEIYNCHGNTLFEYGLTEKERKHNKKIQEELQDTDRSLKNKWERREKKRIEWE